MFKRVDLTPSAAAKPAVPCGYNEALGWGLNESTLELQWWDDSGGVIDQTTQAVPDWVRYVHGTEGDDGSVVLNLSDPVGETRALWVVRGRSIEDATSWTLAQGFMGVPSHFGLWRGSSHERAAVMNATNKEVRVLAQNPEQPMQWCGAVLGEDEFITSGPANNAQKRLSYRLVGGQSTAFAEMHVGGRLGAWLVGTQAYPPFAPARYSAVQGQVPQATPIPTPTGASRSMAHLADKGGNITGYSWGASHSFRPFYYDGATTRWLDEVAPGSFAWPAVIALNGHILTTEGNTSVLLVRTDDFAVEPLTIPIDYGLDSDGLPTIRVIVIRRPDGREIQIPMPKVGPGPGGPHPVEHLHISSKTHLHPNELEATVAFLRESIRLAEAMASDSRRNELKKIKQLEGQLTNRPGLNPKR